MRKASFCSIPLLLLFLVSTAIAQAVWRDYVYLEDGFSISLPVAPDYAVSTLDSVGGRLDVHAYTMELGPARGFALNVIDYKKKEIFTPQKIKEVYQLAKTGVLANTKGKLVSENEVNLGGQQGLDIEIETDKVHLHARYNFSGSKLYTMMTIAPLSQSFAPETGRIFESFRFL